MISLPESPFQSKHGLSVLKLGHKTYENRPTVSDKQSNWGEQLVGWMKVLGREDVFGLLKYFELFVLGFFFFLFVCWGFVSLVGWLFFVVVVVAGVGRETTNEVRKFEPKEKKLKQLPPCIRARRIEFVRPV